MKAGIAGAGIMGRLLALALHNAGWQVTLFDQNTADNNCSYAAAGLLTPSSELDKAELIIFHLGQLAIRLYWPQILQQLSKPIYFQNKGSIVLSHPRDDKEWQLFSRRILNQLGPLTHHCQSLSANELIALEPDLNQFNTAYYFPDEAQIDNQSLMDTLKKYLWERDVVIIQNTPVEHLKAGQIVTGKQSYSYDVVFDCRGLGAYSSFPKLRALRGEVVWLQTTEVNINRPIRFLHPRYRLYIAPRPNHLYLIGASEIEAADYSPISVRTLLELLSATYYLHDGFAEARIIKTTTHCRPTLPDHLPQIKFTEGLIAVNGLFRHGFLIAPTLAEDIVRYINNGKNHIQFPEIWENFDD